MNVPCKVAGAWIAFSRSKCLDLAAPLLDGIGNPAGGVAVTEGTDRLRHALARRVARQQIEDARGGWSLLNRLDGGRRPQRFSLVFSVLVN